MKGFWAIMVAVVTLGAMPFPGVALGQAHQDPPQFTAFPLRTADAAWCVKKLSRLLGEGGDIAVFSDNGTNTVFIRARPEKLQKAKELLDRLDVPMSLKVFHLTNANAAKTSCTLQVIMTLVALFGGDDRDIYINADEGANSIIISVREEKTHHAKAIPGTKGGSIP